MLASKHLYLWKLKIGLTQKQIYGTKKLNRQKKMFFLYFETLQSCQTEFLLPVPSFQLFYSFHDKWTERPPRFEIPVAAWGAPPWQLSDHRTQSHLEDVAGAFAADVVLAGQDDHGFGEQLQADGADQLLLQVLHGGSSAGAGPRTACWWRLVAEGKVHRLQGRRSEKTEGDNKQRKWGWGVSSYFFLDSVSTHVCVHPPWLFLTFYPIKKNLSLLFFAVFSLRLLF